jgi:hypothetical protein
MSNNEGEGVGKCSLVVSLGSAFWDAFAGFVSSALWEDRTLALKAGTRTSESGHAHGGIRPCTSRFYVPVVLLAFFFDASAM